MTVQEVIDHFGGISPIARELQISYQAVKAWKDKGEVPEGRQWQLQGMTKGKLKADSPVSA